MASAYDYIQCVFIILDIIVVGIMYYMWCSWYEYYKQLPAAPPKAEPDS
jgi:hypothetical protein